jgi:hypothetical protein
MLAAARLGQDAFLLNLAVEAAQGGIKRLVFANFHF